MKIEYFRHNIDNQDIEAVISVLKSLTLTTGELTENLENRLASYLDASFAIGLTSCTAALHLSLQALDIGPGDEVITTPFTFAATLSAILHAGATPVLVDVNKRSGNIETSLIENAVTDRTRAIVPVHLYGLMCDMAAIKQIAENNNLRIIEDAAHCLEGRRGDIRPGGLSDAACFSFYANKSITSGEGGAIVTNNSALAERVRRLRLHGLEKDAAGRYSAKFKPYDISELGWKYNMDDIQASLLLNQLKRIKDRHRQKTEIWKRYSSSFEAMTHIETQAIERNTRHAMHIFAIRTPAEIRNEVIEHLEQRGIGVSVHFYPVHLLTFFRKTFGWEKGMFPVTEDLSKRSISLPIYPGLEFDEVDYVIDTVGECLRTLGG